jgi:hypothetical protein
MIMRRLRTRIGVSEPFDFERASGKDIAVARRGSGQPVQRATLPDSSSSIHSS